jgi:hypothetical protein
VNSEKLSGFFVTRAAEPEKLHVLVVKAIARHDTM